MNFLQFLAILSVSSIVASSPVRTVLCCCGCTEHPCPVVGPDCPNPAIPCNSTSSVKCSALQRLYDISQHKDDKNLEVDHSLAPAPSPSLEMERSVFLLPSLDSGDVESVRNDFLEISSKRPAKKSSINEPSDLLLKVTKKMDELELEMRMMRDEITAYMELTKHEREMQEQQVDSTIQPARVRVSRRRRAAGETENCNDDKLKTLIKENIKKDAKSSKREIQKAANKEFGGHFNVICSPCEFSFVVASQKYCDGFKDDVACFAFLQPPTKLKLQ